MATPALDSLILCFQVKDRLILLVCFLLMTLKKTMIYFWVILKMNKCNSLEINKINLSEERKFRLSGITWIENYFHQAINQRKLWIKKLSKYVTVFDYIDKIFDCFEPNSWWGRYLSFLLQALWEHYLEYQVQLFIFYFLTTAIIK